MSTERNSGSATSSTDEAGIDTRRYVAAIRRNAWLIGGIVFAITVVVVALSLTADDRYEATATIVYNPPANDLLTPDTDPERRIATFAQLITSSPVLERAADTLESIDLDRLEDNVTAEVDETADLVDLTAEDGAAGRSADIANAVVAAFIEQQTELQRQQLAVQISELTRQRDSFPPGSVEAELRQRRIQELSQQRTFAGTELQIADPAEVPSGRSSPKPVRNAILGFFFALFLGVLIALGRDQLRPTVTDPRELSRLTRLTVLAGIPLVSSKRGRAHHHAVAMEHEAYQTLGAAIQLALPSSGQHLIMVTSAIHGEGKTTATARLGRVLAEAGHNTLLISGDLRWPALHEAFDLDVEPGLSDVLELIQRSGLSRHLLPATVNSVGLARDSSGNPRSLDVLTSGRQVRDPATLLSGEALGAFFDHVRSFPYSYVLIDGPPMLGIADGQAIAQRVDRVLLVSRLGDLTVETVVDVRELLDRLEVAPLGHVAIGAGVELSPYYQSERAREMVHSDASSWEAARSGRDRGEPAAYPAAEGSRED